MTQKSEKQSNLQRLHQKINNLAANTSGILQEMQAKMNELQQGLTYFLNKENPPVIKEEDITEDQLLNVKPLTGSYFLIKDVLYNVTPIQQDWVIEGMQDGIFKFKFQGLVLDTEYPTEFSVEAAHISEAVMKLREFIMSKKKKLIVDVNNNS